MATIRRQIQLIVEATLGAIPDVPGGCELGRDTEPTKLRAISITDLGDSPGVEDVYHTVRTMRLQVIGDVEGDAGAGAADAMDLLLEQIIVASQTDPQWGGLARNTDLGELAVDPTMGSEIRGLTFGLTLLIEYAHRRGDPTVI